MRRLIYFAAACFMLVSIGLPASAQVQEIDGYTVIKGGANSMVCLGRWIPPQEIGKPGRCEGQMVDVSQLSAISSKQAVDKLDQIILFLASIDQKLSDNSEQIERLIEATLNTQASIDKEIEHGAELLKNNITTRFESLSKRVTTSDAFRKELERLKTEILEEIKKGYPSRH